jgi:hypothetical protein
MDLTRRTFLAGGAGFLLLPWSARARRLAAAPGGAGALQAEILAAYRAGKKSFRIPPGTRRLSAPEGAVSCLRFAGLRDFEIDATGAVLECADRVSSVFFFEACERVILRGATIRHVPVPFSQGRVEAISADRRSLDVRVAAGYPADLLDEKFFTYDGSQWLNIFDPATRLWRRDVPDVYCERPTELAAGLFRFPIRRPAPDALAVGDLAAWRGNGRGDITLYRCAGMQLLDLRIENGVGFCAHENGGEGGNFYRYAVGRGPAPEGATEPPLFACNADAFHSSGVRKGPTLEDCTFEYMDDDGVPIHGAYGIVTVQTSGREITLGAHAKEFCREGDRLRLYNEHGTLLGSGVVQAVAKAEAAGSIGHVAFQGGHPIFHSRITLDAEVSAEPGASVSNLDTLGSGFQVRRCTIRHCRARGLLIKAGDGVIEDNLIEGTTMAGIALWPEFGHWNESDYASGVNIRRNTIRDVALWSEPWNAMAGALTIAAREGKAFAPLPGGHEKILVADNVFERNSGVNVLISTARDLVLEGNQFIEPMHLRTSRGSSAGMDAGALIWITEADGVTLRDNTLERPGSYLHRELLATDTVKNLHAAQAFITRAK